MDQHLETVKIFEHCRLIMGMVLSLAVARLLNGLARFVQHPKKVRIYPVHLCWVFAILLHLIHFWWWEFKLIHVEQWTFEVYLMLILYAISIFLLCSLLFPDEMQEYSGFEEYFMSRRKWFFGIFGLSFVIDLADTALKGAEHFQSLGWEYPIRNFSYIVMCLVAAFSPNKKLQLAFVVIALVYELSYIFRLFHTIQ
ncbi:MAG: hypothetical protein KGS72_14295 [Cyanobacteria bacterium REEB67]|nr:hypothetical protein [Cyanobacteria bacterium REEB67]